MDKTILVPLDGSKRAERILPHVEKIASSFKAQIILLQIVEADHYIYESNGAFAELNIGLLKQQMNTAKQYLNAIQGEYREKGIQVRIIVSPGPVVNKIINIAKSENVGLITMASHGRTGLPRAFYGSVAAGILNRADGPLLLVRAESDV